MLWFVSQIKNLGRCRCERRLLVSRKVLVVKNDLIQDLLFLAVQEKRTTCNLLFEIKHNLYIDL